MSPKVLQRILRNATLVVTFAGGLYLWNRFELFDLPAEGCSPLQSLRPGNKLWVDLYPRRIGVGDVVFFQPPGGEISLGRVERLEEEPQPRYWLGVDDPACPGQDSEALGWVSRDWIQGRMMMALDF